MKAHTVEELKQHTYESINCYIISVRTFKYNLLKEYN